MRTKIHLNENDDRPYEGSVEDLEAALKQKPNRRLVGYVPFYLYVWNWTTSRNKEGRFYDYLKTSIGEAPVLYEPIMLRKSQDQLQRTLFNDGYFDARVEAVAFKDSNTVELHYYISSGPEYRLKNVSYSFEDTALVKEFTGGVRMKFKPGDRYDSEEFEAERKRVSTLMKNRGYFTFDNIHLTFDVDTNLPGERYNVEVNMRNLRITESVGDKDTIIQKSHKIHFISEVLINEDYSQKGFGTRKFDTLQRRGLTFVFVDKHYIRPSRIDRNMFVRPGDKYSLERSNYTYERLNALNNYRFVDLSYLPSQNDSADNLLDVKVNLTRSPRQAMSIETTGTNRSGILGVYSALNYQNRNLFKGAEQFDWKVYGGLEVQRSFSTDAGDAAEDQTNLWFFNTYQAGTQVSITVPDIFFYRIVSSLKKLREPKTSLSSTWDFQSRPEYTRNLINLSYQHSFRFREQDNFTIAPIDLSYIRLDKDPAFQKQLDLTNNQLLINSYNDHIIPAGRVSYSYTTQNLNERRNFYYYRVNFETAGNLLRLMSDPLGLPTDSTGNSYQIDNISFAQYVKVDLNFVQYYNLTENSQVVYRGFGGIGVPLANLNVIPFERSFFAGGSNGVRAWRIRGLGPGSVSETETYGIDQVGEIQLEFNAEYRFDVIKQIEGALFMDVGNIWFIEDEERPEAEFEWDRFYRELAIAPGIGVRLDFTFFVFRFDTGLQLKDPALPAGERWLFQPKDETFRLRQAANDYRESQELNRVGKWDLPYKPEVTLNLAIHYPF